MQVDSQVPFFNPPALPFSPPLTTYPPTSYSISLSGHPDISTTSVSTLQHRYHHYHHHRHPLSQHLNTSADQLLVFPSACHLHRHRPRRTPILLARFACPSTAFSISIHAHRSACLKPSHPRPTHFKPHPLSPCLRHPPRPRPAPRPRLSRRISKARTTKTINPPLPLSQPRLKSEKDSRLFRHILSITFPSPGFYATKWSSP